MSSAAAASIRILPLRIKTVSHFFFRILFISWTALIIVVGATCPVLISGGGFNKYEIEIHMLVVFFSLLLAAKLNRDMAADIYVPHITASLTLEEESVIQRQSRNWVEFEMSRDMDDNHNMAILPEGGLLITMENPVIQIQNRKGVEFEMACYKDGNYNISTLPEDLLVEIFLRSSVKCLIRAKCVCKYWYGLIKDPSFAYKHLYFQKHTKKDRLLVQHSTQETQSYSYTIVDGIPQSNATCHIRDCLQLPDCGLYMEGPVDGVYCLFNGCDRVVLWNPALMDFKTLPLPPSHISPEYTVASGLGIVGFGVDPLTNDYKVVLIRRFCNDYDLSGERSTTVYSLSTNTWRLVDFGIGRPYPFCNSLSNSFLSGTHYWWSKSYRVVLTFHMSEETFGVIPGPIIPPEDREEWHYSKITVYEDRVALLQQTSSLVNIWVLLEEECSMWIKQFSIQPTPEHFWLLGFCGNNGPFLVLGVSDGDYDHPVCSGGQMVLYNCITQEMSNVGLKGASHSLQACIYHESLVSVNGETKCKGMLDQFKMVSAFLSGDPSF